MNRRIFFIICLLTGACSFTWPPPARVTSANKYFTGGPKRGVTDTLVIPFEYKQSAIFHKYTLDVLDSVVTILNNNKDITVSLEGYSYVDEGNDTICKYLSLDRALFIRDAILGRGIDSGRITSIKAMGQWKPEKRGHYKINNNFHCRVELLMIYPAPPEKPVIADGDMDGIPDAEDACPDNFGYAEDKGCPLKDVYFVLFDPGQTYISYSGFKVSDEVLNMLKTNPAYTIRIGGHASKEESTKSVGDKISEDRADIISRYLLSRNIAASRIEKVSSYGSTKPVNAQRNPKEINQNECAEIILNRHGQ